MAGRQGGGRLHGPSTLREGPPQQNEYCEEARLQEAHRVHNAPKDTCERQRGHTGVCAPNAPSDTRALRRSGFEKQVHHHSERNTAIVCVPSASVVVSVTSACPAGN